MHLVLSVDDLNLLRLIKNKKTKTKKNERIIFRLPFFFKAAFIRMLKITICLCYGCADVLYEHSVIQFLR